MINWILELPVHMGPATDFGSLKGINMSNMTIGLLIATSIIPNVNTNPMQQVHPVVSVVRLAQAPPEDPPLPPEKDAPGLQGDQKSAASAVKMPPEDPPPKPDGKVKPGTATVTGEEQSK